jgi:hypothetical protein
MNKAKMWSIYPGMENTKKRFRAAGKIMTEELLKEKIDLLVRIALSTENGHFDSALTRKTLFNVQIQLFRAIEIAYKKTGK